jgi:hypothetical protein
MWWAGHVACIGETRNAYTVLVGTPEGTGSLRRPTRKYEDNVNMDLKEIRCEGVDRIYLIQDGIQ